MKEQTFIKTAGAIFLVITLLQLARIMFGWQANIGGWEVPMGVSYIAVVLAGFLAYSAYKLVSVR